MVLSSPIILYDHPAVAPESDGALYDATEIDEILALRDADPDRRREGRGACAPTRARPRSSIACDDMEPDVWARMHGTMRELLHAGPARGDRRRAAAPVVGPAVDAASIRGPTPCCVGGVEVAKGTSVRLRPSRRADAHDMFFDGMVATVAGVFHDVDGELHVAVTVDDDPATEPARGHGRYLYFHPDESRTDRREATP